MKSIGFLDVAAIVGLIVFLIGVRFFQHSIFYDPLDPYFHGNFQAQPIPEMNIFKLFLSNSLRYLLNGVFSIGILWMLFKSSSYIKASLWVYLFALVLLNAVFLLMLQWEIPIAKMALFYSRRFIIHPLLLFVLVAGGFYLHNKTSKTD